MAQTVIGLFENESDARSAAAQLETAGIPRSRVDVGRSGAYTQQQDVRNERENENGLTRFFKNLFGDNDDADRYTRVSNSGDYCIVTVHAQSEEEAERAADLLDDYGALNVDERDAGDSRRAVSGNGNSLRSTDRMDLDSDRPRHEDRSGDDATVQRVEENLNVGKREEDRGGVRVRSRIVERPVEETLRLREEHVHVERKPVDRPLTDADRDAFQEQNIEFTERAEVPVVNKEARVVEEIRISKDVEERNETIHDTVRRTEVDVDKMDGHRNVNDDASLRNETRPGSDEHRDELRSNNPLNNNSRPGGL